MSSFGSIGSYHAYADVRNNMKVAPQPHRHAAGSCMQYEDEPPYPYEIAQITQPNGHK